MTGTTLEPVAGVVGRTRLVRLASAVCSPALEWPVLGALLLMGGLLRAPNLQNLPKLTDELRDSIYSLPIAQGQSFPLANFSSYDGALFNYLEAVVFRVFGPDLDAPRNLMFWLGLVGLALTYVYVRGRHGPTAAVIATTMLAVSPVHILVNSRVAWGNCLTPLFTTAGFWLLDRGMARPPAARSAGLRHPGWKLAGAGLAFGLALQTHPTVVAFLPGAAATVALGRPALLKTRWPWLGLAGFLAGYANMVAFNLANDFESISFARRTRTEYVGAEVSIGSSYLDNMLTLLTGLFRLLGGAVEDRVSTVAFLGDLLLIVAAVTCLVGLIFVARRGDRLPLLVTLSGVLCLPALNNRYEPVLDGRYLAPLQPLFAAGAASLILALWRWRGRVPWQPLSRAGCLLALMALAAWPLAGLGRYLDQNGAAALRNARLRSGVDLAERGLPLGSDAIFDRDLERAILGAGSTELLVFEYAFTMHGLPYRTVRVTPGGLAQLISPNGVATTSLVVMERAKRKLLESQLRVQQLDSETVERGVQPFFYGVYLVSWEPRS